ncbi:MAG TPA: hypothetical protein VKF82_02235 [Candidatus Eremiobacteraceae bacterium]|nr:hypothetical protein [Candidatus Eremiobacteraceae bacterium]
MDQSVQTLAPDLWTTLRGVFELDPHAFVAGLALRDSALVAFAIVFLAGLSEAIGQSVVLFANRIKPARFFLSLAVTALLFGFSYVFLTLSTWAITFLPLATRIPLRSLAIVFALSYAPLLLGFLEALPYMGVPVGWLLRIWYLLASLVGVAAVGHLSVLDAILYVGVGWLALVIVRQIIGRPVALLTARIMSAVSGVEDFDMDEVAAISRAEAQPAAPQTTAATPGAAQSARPAHPPSRRVTALIGALGFVVVGVVIAVSVKPLQNVLFGWTIHLPVALRLPFDLLWFGVVALLVAAILAPLETLGWWAGWYGGEIQGDASKVAADGGGAAGISRYIIYLDGIGQSSSTYTPDVETFLDALAPALPQRVRLLRGLMVYSVLNKPLEEDPIWSGFWTIVDKLRFANPASLLGMFVNLRNVIIVAVSADSRYGPIYNYGIAKVLYDGLLEDGYRVGSGVPVTLIGYSGGGQMSAASAGLLKRAIGAPVEVISLGGVMSGANDFLDLMMLHHLVGEKDGVERLGPLLFPSRWKIAWNSFWNRARRLGLIEIISLGPVGHQVPGGMFDPVARLPNGQTYLTHTIENISDIVRAKP